VIKKLTLQMNRSRQASVVTVKPGSIAPDGD